MRLTNSLARYRVPPMVNEQSECIIEYRGDERLVVLDNIARSVKEKLEREKIPTKRIIARSNKADATAEIWIVFNDPPPVFPGLINYSYPFSKMELQSIGVDYHHLVDKLMRELLGQWYARAGNGSL